MPRIGDSINKKEGEAKQERSTVTVRSVLKKGDQLYLKMDLEKLQSKENGRLNLSYRFNIISTFL